MRWGEKPDSCPLAHAGSVLGVMASVYVRWPWRPHCSATSHVQLCRVVSALFGADNKPCPKRGLPRPPGV